MNVREHRDDLARRAQIFLIFANLLLVGIGVGFWTTQGVNGDEYRELAENNRLRAIPIRAARGVIFDRAGNVLAENIPGYSLLLDRTRSSDLAASLAFGSSLLGVPVEELQRELARHRGTASYQPVELAANLTLSEVARVNAANLEHPEFEIEVRQRRFYRYGPQTAHVLGYLGEVSERELERDGSPYQPGDQVGRKGLEAAYDLRVRGHDGQRIVVVDSRGRSLEEYGREPARPGENITLSLDLGLQQTADRLLAERVGAIVALDPRNGEILALASSPSYNPNPFTRRITADEWNALVSAPHHPMHNRALQATYSPGSVFKIVMAVAGLSEGVRAPSDGASCAGAVTIYNHRYRCWKRGGHGFVDLHRAIKYSCDVYFYRLGQTLGIERIADYSRRFGLGQPTGVDIRGERPGLVPDLAWSLKARGQPWYAGETISVAIGQGPLLTTPLQVARMVAAVANGGTLVTPHVVRDAEAPSRPLDISKSSLDIVRRGLWGVVNEGDGTGGQARLAEHEVAGKTGTVQVVTQKTWTASETLPFEQRDHAWFASFAPFDDPSLVVVVFSEHGGKGSSEAAPLARAMYEQYFGTTTETDVQPADGD